MHRSDIQDEFGLPPEFTTRLRRIVPAAAFPSVIASFAAPGYVAFRIEALRFDPAAVLRDLRSTGITPTPLDWTDHAFLAPPEQRDLLTHSAAAETGAIYIQNASSLLPVLALDPRPGEEVLDLAAAPGGKTLHIAARMKNRGRIAAVEPVRPRFFRLLHNVRRAGADIVHCYRRDGRSVGRILPDRFDRVLLDAPCSTESRVRAGKPETWRTWSTRKIAECSRKQRALLASALRSVRPGGIVVYSTCSFAPEENEAVIHDLLSAGNPRFEILPWKAPVPNVSPGLTHWGRDEFDPSLARAVRILPTDVFDGLFICVLRRADDGSIPR